MTRNAERNRRIVELVQQGHTYRSAADELGVSMGVVSGVCQRAGLRVGRAERLRQLHANPEFRAACIERLRRAWDKPEVRAAQSRRAAERMRRMHANPEFRAAAAERMRRLNAEPEFRAARLERLRRLNADPECVAARVAKWRRSRAQKIIPRELIDEFTGDLPAISSTYRQVTPAAVSDWYGISPERAQCLLQAVDPSAFEAIP